MDTGVLNISDGNAPQTENFAIGQFTRDMSLASGTQGITGLGFKPTLILFWSADAGVAGTACWGASLNGGNVGGMFDASAGSAFDYNFSGSDIQANVGATDDYTGNVTSYDVDGFTMTWTRLGTPTGTLVVNYHAFK